MSQRIPPLIRIANATFYRQRPRSVPPSQPSDKTTSSTSQANATSDDVDASPLFPDLTFTLPATDSPKQHWAVLSQSSASRTNFLQILRGKFLCFPPTARSYPYLTSEHLSQKDANLRIPSRAIQYVGFDAERGGASSNIRGAYLSARYESRREITDFSVRDYLAGNTELNADESLTRHADAALLNRITTDLKLINLLDMPVTQLSNGQTRRARIAKALLERPELLLLDGPFMGLDPPTVTMLSRLLYGMASAEAPRLLLSLSPGEHTPDWITHLVVTDDKYRVSGAGPRDQVQRDIYQALKWKSKEEREMDATEERDRPQHFDMGVFQGNFMQSKDKYQVKKRIRTGLDLLAQKRKEGKSFEEMLYDGHAYSFVSRDAFPLYDPALESGEPVVEMDGVRVQYGEKVVLGYNEGKEGLRWTVRRGERWGVFGANGSGKTTLLSLISSDHPQTYSQPVRLFGRSRLPEAGKPGISIFELQGRIGHSSPEVHSFFPKHLTVRRALESAWAETPIVKPRMTAEMDELVTRALYWFQAELNPRLGNRPWMDYEVGRSMQTEKLWAMQRPPKTAHGKSTLEEFKELWHNDTFLDTPTWADDMRFGELTFSAQRVLLFLRAIIKSPDLVILDEAFSGMDAQTKLKCQLYLSHGENMMLRPLGGYRGTKQIRRSGPIPAPSYLWWIQDTRFHGLNKNQALVVVSHRPDEVPGSVRDWMCLEQPGEGQTRTGRLIGPLSMDNRTWDAIWDPKESAKLPKTLEEWEANLDSARKLYGLPVRSYDDGSRPLTWWEYFRSPEELNENKRLADELRARIENFRVNYGEILTGEEGAPVSPNDAAPSTSPSPSSSSDEAPWTPSEAQLPERRLAIRDLARLFNLKTHGVLQKFIDGTTHNPKSMGYRAAKSYLDRLDGIEPDPEPEIMSEEQRKTWSWERKKKLGREVYQRRLKREKMKEQWRAEEVERLKREVERLKKKDGKSNG